MNQYFAKYTTKIILEKYDNNIQGVTKNFGKLMI